jgi:hypothetical protein
MEDAIARPAKPKVAGWLLLFIARFYVGGLITLAGAAGKRSPLYTIIGACELILGILLSLRSRKGLILARAWLLSETAVFIILAALAFLPPTDGAAGALLSCYAIGSLLIAIYFFRSSRVKNTYY